MYVQRDKPKTAAELFAFMCTQPRVKGTLSGNARRRHGVPSVASMLSASPLKSSTWTHARNGVSGRNASKRYSSLRGTARRPSDVVRGQPTTLNPLRSDSLAAVAFSMVTWNT